MDVTFWPLRVAEIDLAAGTLTDPDRCGDRSGAERAVAAEVLVRLGGTPVGSVRVPLVEGCWDERDLAARIDAELAGALLRATLLTALETGRPVPRPEDLALQIPPISPISQVRTSGLPSITVAICTRDRTDDLARCLTAVDRLHDRRGLLAEVLVVDNAPASDSTRRLVAERFPTVRYLHEPRPGLDWARNRAVLEATGDVVAFTDDDTVVDRGWVDAIADAFGADDDVMAVLGLVLPYELRTEAQQRFERLGGFGRGFHRRWFHADTAGGRFDASAHPSPSAYGTGANMAFRRTVFAAVGLFDTALDVGTPAGGAGDTDALYRVIKGGWTVAYEPSAIVRHRHRDTIEALQRQLAANGATVCHLQAAARRHPDERDAMIGVARWLGRYYAKRLLSAAAIPGREPLSLPLAEATGHIRAALGRRYDRSRRAAAAVEAEHGPHPALGVPAPRPTSGRGDAAAVRLVELTEPVGGIDDVRDVRTVRLVATVGGTPIGQATVVNAHRALSGARVREVLVDELWLRLVAPAEAAFREPIEAAAWGRACRFATTMLPTGAPRTNGTTTARAATPRRAVDLEPVTVLVATRLRPDDLRRCLASLATARQTTRRRVDVLVVDNAGHDPATREAVGDCPGVEVVAAPVAGLARARNVGLAAARTDLVVITDDDAVVDPGWIDALLGPFAHGDVAAVTGNVLPVELETRAQQDFEAVAPLGRGFLRREADQRWATAGRHAVPTWDLGAGANLAVRRSSLRTAGVSGFDEALGAGTPTGCAEDSYLLYQLLVRGHRVVYEPSAVVWHRHRRTPEALQSQLHHYYRGAVAHQLATLQHEHDLRAVDQLLRITPAWIADRRRAGARGEIPAWFWRTAAGGLARGPAAYVRSRRFTAAHPPAVPSNPPTGVHHAPEPRSR